MEQNQLCRQNPIFDSQLKLARIKCFQSSDVTLSKFGYNVFISRITLSIFSPKFHILCVQCKALGLCFLVFRRILIQQMILKPPSPGTPLCLVSVLRYFSKIFYCLPRVPRQFFLIFCKRMDVKKSQISVPLFTFFGTSDNSHYSSHTRFSQYISNNFFNTI